MNRPVRPAVPDGTGRRVSQKALPLGVKLNAVVKDIKVNKLWITRAQRFNGNTFIKSLQIF
jgi:hypothetical protein